VLPSTQPIKMKTLTPAQPAAAISGQLNKSYSSVAAMRRSGFGSRCYAYFNCKRWNAVAGDYVCKLEFNGELPRVWRDFFRSILS
jgi:hypothetical protein